MNLKLTLAALLIAPLALTACAKKDEAPKNDAAATVAVEEKIYMHQYPTNAISFYPTCPDCEQAGLLLGTADTIDIVKHPKTFAKTLIKQISHKLGKAH